MSDYRRYFVPGGTYFFTLVTAKRAPLFSSDLEAHFDYIHYNPVKHGLVRSPRDWPWSTFHRWVRAGHYNSTWAAAPDEKRLPGGAGE
ncbi:MAG: hypothetical protein WD063_12770 [Pirellulales bacterium]